MCVCSEFIGFALCETCAITAHSHSHTCHIVCSCVACMHVVVRRTTPIAPPRRARAKCMSPTSLDAVAAAVAAATACVRTPSSAAVGALRAGHSIVQVDTVAPCYAGIINYSVCIMSARCVMRLAVWACVLVKWKHTVRAVATYTANSADILM